MSYSFSFELAAGEDIAAKVGQAFDEEAARYTAGGAERRALMAEVEPAIAAAAATMLEAVSRPGDAVGVTISGHHNTGKAPAPGSSDCGMTITLSQRPAKASA